VISSRIDFGSAVWLFIPFSLCTS